MLPKRYGLYIVLAIIASVMLFHMEVKHLLPWVHETQYEIIDNSALSPYRYRILTPFILHPFVMVFGLTPTYMVANGIMFITLFIFFDEWLTLSGIRDKRIVIIAILFTFAMLPIMLLEWGVFIWSPLEVVLLLAALIQLSNESATT